VAEQTIGNTAERCSDRCYGYDGIVNCKRSLLRLHWLLPKRKTWWENASNQSVCAQTLRKTSVPKQ